MTASARDEILGPGPRGDGRTRPPPAVRRSRAGRRHRTTWSPCSPSASRTTAPSSSAARDASCRPRLRRAARGLASSCPPGCPSRSPDAVVDDGLSRRRAGRHRHRRHRGALGIAETGTIVLDHGPGQGRRAITLVPDRHVCVVRADQVVADVPEAMPRSTPPAR